MDGVDTTGEDEQNSEDVLVECLKCGSSANIVAVDCGANPTVAMSPNGRVWCWGSGLRTVGFWKLHEHSGPESGQPFGDRQVAVAVAAGGESTCALTCKGYGNEWDGGGDMGTLSAPSQSTDDKGIQ